MPVLKKVAGGLGAASPFVLDCGSIWGRDDLLRTLPARLAKRVKSEVIGQPPSLTRRAVWEGTGQDFRSDHIDVVSWLACYLPLLPSEEVGGRRRLA